MAMATVPEMTPAAATPPPGGALTPKQPVVDIACRLMTSNCPPWHLLLSGLTWKDYQRLLDARAAAGRRAVRITYSRGEVEIMTVSDRRERWKKLIARMLETEVRELDFTTDPPPDVAIEVEVSRNLSDRIALYDAMGVPEIWRYDGDRLMILHRGATGGYTEAAVSMAFPTTTAELLTGYLARAGTVDDTMLCFELFTWAQQIA